MKIFTVSFNWLFQIVQPIYYQSKKWLRKSLFTLLFVQFFNIYFFFNVFSSSFQSMFKGLLSVTGGRSCCQRVLLLNIHYILHFARFPIPIFKISFAISTFDDFLRYVQPKWFYFKHRSRTIESVLMAIIFWQTKQNHFELFFLVVKSQTFCLCRIFTILSY